MTNNDAINDVVRILHKHKFVEAADYVAKTGVDLPEFTPVPNLRKLFEWSKTPQGFAYWVRIWARIKEDGDFNRGSYKT